MNEVRSAKVTTLVDNLVEKPGLLGQWGLSFLLEIEDKNARWHKVVFDTGAVKDALLYNIKKLRVNLSDLEYLVLSHGHSDHTAATVELLKMAKREVKVVSHPHVYLPRFYFTKKKKRKESGLPKGEGLEDIKKARGCFITAKKPVELFPGVYTTGEIPRATDFETIPPPLTGGQRLIEIGGKATPDLILDDQALLINVEKRGPVVITGCAHSGIVNTLLHVQNAFGFKVVYGVIGGLHLIQRGDSYIGRTVEKLRSFGLELVAPCHCTGFKAACALRQALPEAFVLNFSGRSISPGKETKTRTL